MMKKLRVLLLSVLALISLLLTARAEELPFAGGDGTEESPYRIATAEQLGKLGRYVEKLLAKVADELRSGNISADPCGHNENDSVCGYCEFASACHFMDGYAEDRMKILRPVQPPAFWEYVEQVIGKEEA